MNEWFAERKRYDVSLLGIVDKGVKEKGRQYNFVYGERGKHGWNEICSMMHYFVTTTILSISNANKIHLHSD